MAELERNEAAAPADDRAPAHEEHEHPGVRTYVLVGVALAILTAMEVAAIYIPFLAPVVIPILLVLTAGKFALVVMFYMHLKMDDRIFSWVFIAPSILAVFVVVALILLFRVLPQFHG
jgi:cytochrome c oxidase subunit IV